MCWCVGLSGSLGGGGDVLQCVLMCFFESNLVT